MKNLMVPSVIPRSQVVRTGDGVEDSFGIYVLADHVLATFGASFVVKLDCETARALFTKALEMLEEAPCIP